MALDFGADNLTRHYTIANGAGNLDLPASDWAIGAWTRLPHGLDLAGNHFPVVLGAGPIGGFNSFYLYFGGLATSRARELTLRLRAASGAETVTTIATNIGDASGIDDVDRLVVVQSRGGNLEVYYVAERTTVTTPTVTVNNPPFASDVLSAGDWEFGNAADTGFTYDYNNVASELFFIVDGSLTAAQVEALAYGQNIAKVYPTPEANLRFFQPDATVEDLAGDHDATQVGTGWATADHPFVDPTGVNVTVSEGNAVAAGAAVASATGVQATTAVGTAEASVDETATPTGVQVTTATGTVTVTGQATVSATGVQVTVELGEETASGVGTASVTGVTTTTAVGTGAGAGQAEVQPAGQAATASVGDTVATGSALIEVLGVQAQTQLGEAVASAGTQGSAQPTGVSVTTSVGDTTGQGRGQADVTGVQASTAVGTATAATTSTGDADATGVELTTASGTVVGRGKSITAVTGVNLQSLLGVVTGSGRGRVEADGNQATVGLGNETAGGAGRATPTGVALSTDTGVISGTGAVSITPVGVIMVVYLGRTEESVRPDKGGEGGVFASSAVTIRDYPVFNDVIQQ